MYNSIILQPTFWDSAPAFFKNEDFWLKAMDRMFGGQRQETPKAQTAEFTPETLQNVGSQFARYSILYYSIIEYLLQTIASLIDKKVEDKLGRVLDQKLGRFFDKVHVHICFPYSKSAHSDLLFRSAKLELPLEKPRRQLRTAWYERRCIYTYYFYLTPSNPLPA